MLCILDDTIILYFADMANIVVNRNLENFSQIIGMDGATVTCADSITISNFRNKGAGNTFVLYALLPFYDGVN